ncbi:MAG TPA: HAD family hydrolase [Kofleriaceae bacterium]|nr:HAD family hydrolase [Kofleriaceae bacterium]
MYRLLALDLDGTLLRRDHSVDERDRAAIAELQRAGVAVTIVTGRLHSGALGAARACAIEGAIACVEGSHLVEVDTARTLARHPMSPAVTALLREQFGAHGLAAFVFEADGIHHDASGEPYAGYVRTWSPKLQLVEEALDARVWASDPLAAVAVGEADAVAAVHAALRPHAAQVFSVSFPVWTIPGTHAVLVRTAGPTKGTALAELCAVRGCTLAEAVVVGDWVNDVPMFEVAGRSFVMGSAPEAVRAAASDVLACETGAGGGIAEAIRRAFG